MLHDRARDLDHLDRTRDLDHLDLLDIGSETSTVAQPDAGDGTGAGANPGSKQGLGNARRLATLA
jgi:hypothetical protein